MSDGTATSWKTRPTPSIVVHRTNAIVLANGQAERTLGYSKAERMGQPIELLVAERYRAAHVKQCEGFFKRQRLRPMGAGLELVALRKDGSEFPVEISLSPYTNGAQQRGELVTAVVQDISERVRNERMPHTVAEGVSGSTAVEFFQSLVKHVANVFDADFALLCRLSADRMACRSLAETILHFAGYTEDATLRHGIQQSRVEFLQKPCVPSQLTDTVWQVVNHERRRSADPM